ncbi:phosphatidylinositol mannoside acyltransferase [Cellulomonas sp. zg-ZUI222]|uniref:Phosphatidylinositol mannoside acyltransferase n=1 Tax=Cellulomonas wangleii TaxID=2816956 RepID=A0ABX8D9T4_9CELL|nr:MULTISPECIES: phosphatidylinositol mannoside acyltransferase [Cellulomonas]MBO0900412.1 phosphatidylinositol mannoside acyltransferase [Cellulomonas sp. zg-ZUI22]MBO0922758.1 phosphatidylinositol mannoside acyltransferase [Cellulomonas wangleii]MBO0926377.1 phosphatidylinositol mannoside acyltransferase [Cellulomonas wangleii]QVI64200.1 phosphatidylinositol mannoside acyltransferase [Cellulomonas wangleii]
MDVARAYHLAWRVGHRVPGVVVRGLSTLGADVAWARRGSGVRRLEANLARVRPELDERALRRLSRAGMRSYMRYFGEAFTLRALSTDQLAARVRVEGLENLLPHLDEGRQIVVALGHTGNWDLAGAWAAAHVAPVTTVAERLKPEELFQEFLAFRESIGLRIIPLTGGGDVFRQLVHVTRTGPGLLPLLADRDLTAKGLEVDLFGQRARVAAGPAALAVTTGAPLVAASISYERLRRARRRAAGGPWGIVVRFSPRIEVPADAPRADRVHALTQAWVDVLADQIQAHPQDWHMLQRVFVADLDPARDAARRATGEPAAGDDALGPETAT